MSPKCQKILFLTEDCQLLELIAEVCRGGSVREQLQELSGQIFHRYGQPIKLCFLCPSSTSTSTSIVPLPYTAEDRSVIYRRTHHILGTAPCTSITGQPSNEAQWVHWKPPHAHMVTPRGERVQRNESLHRGICVYGGYAVDGVVTSVQDIPSVLKRTCRRQPDVVC